MSQQSPKAASATPAISVQQDDHLCWVNVTPYQYPEPKSVKYKGKIFHSVTCEAAAYPVPKSILFQNKIFKSDQAKAPALQVLVDEDFDSEDDKPLSHFLPCRGPPWQVKKKKNAN